MFYWAPQHGWQFGRRCVAATRGVSAGPSLSGALGRSGTRPPNSKYYQRNYEAEDLDFFQPRRGTKLFLWRNYEVPLSFFFSPNLPYSREV